MQETLSARDRILTTALRLFYRDGIRATGIDRIIAESGVAKMSFYRHFPSKADLVRAFLAARHERWMGWFTAAVERRFATEGLAAIAGALAEWFAEEDFRGCAFINTVAESGAAFPAAVEHKRELEAYIRGLAERLSLPSPGGIAAKSMILVEGIIVRAQMGETAGLAEIAALMFTDLTQSSD
ncbi:MAG TPA: helix-turn-helix domain-containing protein [Magnetospirillaceae bacterium]|nr:helix-turn-helix domain-containing protein [Magnetospirillaceae bacterium]